MRATEILFESRAAVLKAEAEAKLLDKQIELERLRLDAKAIRDAALDEAETAAIDAVAFTGGTVDTEAHVRAAIRALKGKT